MNPPPSISCSPLSLRFSLLSWISVRIAANLSCTSVTWPRCVRRETQSYCRTLPCLLPITALTPPPGIRSCTAWRRNRWDHVCVCVPEQWGKKVSMNQSVCVLIPRISHWACFCVLCCRCVMMPVRSCDCDDLYVCVGVGHTLVNLARFWHCLQHYLKDLFQQVTWRQAPGCRTNTVFRGFTLQGVNTNSNFWQRKEEEEGSCMKQGGEMKSIFI